MGTSYNTNVVSDGIKFYWDAANRRSSPGTGSEGTAWTDLIKGKIGTLDNQATFTTHKGGYVEFDGTDDSVQIPNDADFTMPAGDWTICVWCADLGGNTDKRHIIGTYGFYPKWVIRDTDDHAAGWAFVTNSGDGWEKAYSTVDIQETDDEWHYLVVTGSAGGSSGSLKLYTDGVDTSLSSSYAVESITRSTDTIYMGIASDNGHDFMGYIASVAIYSRILTPAEVKQNYEATKSRFVPRITKSGMFASWDAGDPESYVGGTTLKDTANHYDGTFVNNGSGGDVSFDSANGGSLVFDGSDDYVNIITLPNCSSLARSAIIWVAVDDWPTSGSSVYTPFQSAADQFDISFGVTDSKIYFNGGGGTASTAQKWVTLSPVPADGAWICWAMTIDSSGDIVAMYRNAVALTAGGNSSGFTIKEKTTIGCRIGTDGSSVENSLEGKVGSLRLYTKTLSAAEIMDNFQKTRGRFGV